MNLLKTIQLRSADENEIQKQEEALRALLPNYDDLLRVAACLFIEAKGGEEVRNVLISLMHDMTAIQVIANGKFPNEVNLRLREELLNSRIDSLGVMLKETLVSYTKARSKAKASHAANSGHSKSGGSREKQEKIRTIWASGKYANRDVCAEQECAYLGMSFSTARKALRNTPKPAQPLPSKA